MRFPNGSCTYTRSNPSSGSSVITENGSLTAGCQFREAPHQKRGVGLCLVFLAGGNRKLDVMKVDNFAHGSAGNKATSQRSTLASAVASSFR